MKILNAEEVKVILVEEGIEYATSTLNRWLARGDGVAVYRNEAMDHSKCGHRKLVSYGSPAAQLEVDEPPQRMPDIGGEINWPYQLEGIYKGEPIQ